MRFNDEPVRHVQSRTTGGRQEIRIKAAGSVGVAAIFVLILLALGTWDGFLTIKHDAKMMAGGVKYLEMVYTYTALFFSVIGHALALFVGLYYSMGEEIISLKDGILRIKISVLGLGRSRQFQAALIQNLRLADFIEMSHLKRIRSGFEVGSRGNICFDYEDVTYRFGILPEAEATQVIDRMAAFLPNAVQRSAEQKVF
jgi:hypothetical protein